MNLVDKKVIHETFGKGSVVNYNDNYIKIDFESGAKRFVFPDVFGKYMTLVDPKAANLVKIKIQKREEEKKKEELRLRKEKALEQERQHILEQKKPMQSRKVHPK
ncbi:MAG: malate synthase, partial [Tissierellia bacterium]|nr:malate synthase [Tissierellia bacterium]